MKKTDWFPKKTNPVHPGYYEVNMVSWPWPSYVKWSKKNGWKTEITIKQWRGLTKKAK